MSFTLVNVNFNAMLIAYRLLNKLNFPRSHIPAKLLNIQVHFLPVELKRIVTIHPGIFLRCIPKISD